jgi:23S rRNA pseudouridine1911/1915/1917 synthase
MMTEPLVVLFEDPHCLAVVKPAGLLTQGTKAGEPTLETAVRRHLNPGASQSPYLGTVHRLDRPVSGVVLWARTTKAARRLADQFARRLVRKEYWAIVEGEVPASDPDEVWDDWLAPADASGVVRWTAPGTPGARRAITRVRVSDASAARLPAGTSWLRLWPESGRTHQLRAQAACRGRPILGDGAYGSSRSFPHGIALHARALTVRHPVLRTPLILRAPLPDAWGASGFASSGPLP